MIIKTINISTLRSELKATMDEVCDDKVVYIIPRPKNENVVIMSEKEYRRLSK